MADELDLYNHSDSCIKCNGETRGDPSEDKEIVCDSCGFAVKQHSEHGDIRYAYL